MNNKEKIGIYFYGFDDQILRTTDANQTRKFYMDFLTAGEKKFKEKDWVIKNNIEITILSSFSTQKHAVIKLPISEQENLPEIVACFQKIRKLLKELKIPFWVEEWRYEKISIQLS